MKQLNDKLLFAISFIIFTIMNADLIKNELLEWLTKIEDKSFLTSLLQFKNLLRLAIGPII
jgi:hypothetical protein